jgi:c-di-GMP-binding flagellar brake protein YcgR
VALRGVGNDHRAVGEFSLVRPGHSLILSGEEDDVDFMPLASQDQIDCIVVVDRVTVRFLARVRSLRIAEGRLLLETDWPQLVLRRQRRENFRMRLAPGRTPVLHLPSGFPGSDHACPVRDLSGGGLCMQIESSGIELLVGDVIRGCRLELNPVESVTLSLLVRSREQWALMSGEHGWRYGCAFENVSPAAEQLIRRYVIHAERLSLRERMRQR